MAEIHKVCVSLSDPYYLQIGAIVHRWATLEYFLSNIIWRAMKLDNKQGRVLTIGMRTQTLCGVIRNLPRRWISNADLESKIDDLLASIKTHVEMRNYLVHGVWTAPKGDLSAPPFLSYMKTGEERILPGGEPISPDQLFSFAQEVANLNSQAEVIVGMLGGVQPPSQDIL